MECVSDIVKCVLPSMPIPVTAGPLFHRIHAQCDHISETYFAGFDLGERSWGMWSPFSNFFPMGHGP